MLGPASASLKQLSSFSSTLLGSEDPSPSDPAPSPTRWDLLWHHRELPSPFTATLLRAEDPSSSDPFALVTLYFSSAEPGGRPNSRRPSTGWPPCPRPRQAYASLRGWRVRRSAGLRPPRRMRPIAFCARSAIRRPRQRRLAGPGFSGSLWACLEPEPAGWGGANTALRGTVGGVNDWLSADSFQL